MDKIEKFVTLFSEFDLVIEHRRKDEPKKKNAASYTDSTASKTANDLRKKLNRLTREYKQAQKSFKNNKISRQELFDFEWRIFEIQEELKRIDEKPDEKNY
jgi:hypothetical protein